MNKIIKTGGTERKVPPENNKKVLI